MDINLLTVKSQYQEKSAIFPDSELFHAKAQGEALIPKTLAAPLRPRT